MGISFFFFFFLIYIKKKCAFPPFLSFHENLNKSQKSLSLSGFSLSGALQIFQRYNNNNNNNLIGELYKTALNSSKDLKRKVKTWNLKLLRKTLQYIYIYIYYSLKLYNILFILYKSIILKYYCNLSNTQNAEELCK